jgi:Mg-chelatase subunit ChlD
MAVRKGHVKLTKLLLEAGADPALRVNGASVLDVAISLSHAEIENLLRASQPAELRVDGREPSTLGIAAGGGEDSVAARSLQPLTAPAPPERKKAAPSSLRAVLEEEEEEEECDEEEEEAEAKDDEEEEEEDDEEETDIAAQVEGLMAAETLQGLSDGIRQLTLCVNQSRRKVRRPAVDEALAAARARQKKLRLVEIDPLYGIAGDLPEDFQPWLSSVYSAHTVLMVDCSGSMRTADVATETGNRITRAEAVRRVLLDIFLRGQLAAGARPSERVSLIRIQPEDKHTGNNGSGGGAGMEEIAMPFALFPLDASLAERISDALREPRSHGPYLPALKRLKRLLTLVQPHLLPHARTSILFLSDGRPSDPVDERVLPRLIQDELASLVSLEAFQLLGFGEADEGILKMMADAVPGRAATCELISGPGGYTSLAQSVSTFSSSVTVSRISSVSAVAHQKPLRSISRSFTERLDLYSECDIELPPQRIGDFLGPLLPLRGSHDLLISSTLLGYGGERNAYLMRFARDNNFTTSDEEWVVKESRHERSDLEEEEFHKKALVTQKAAEELANKFNEEAVALGLAGLPKVAYMTCCMVATGKMAPREGVASDPKEPEARLLFAERKIDGNFRSGSPPNQGHLAMPRPTLKLSGSLVRQEMEHELWGDGCDGRGGGRWERRCRGRPRCSGRGSGGAYIAHQL